MPFRKQLKTHLDLGNYTIFKPVQPLQSTAFYVLLLLLFSLLCHPFSYKPCFGQRLKFSNAVTLPIQVQDINRNFFFEPSELPLKEDIRNEFNHETLEWTVLVQLQDVKYHNVSMI